MCVTIGNVGAGRPRSAETATRRRRTGAAAHTPFARRTTVVMATTTESTGNIGIAGDQATITVSGTDNTDGWSVATTVRSRISTSPNARYWFRGDRPAEPRQGPQ